MNEAEVKEPWELHIIDFPIWARLLLSAFYGMWFAWCILIGFNIRVIMPEKKRKLSHDTEADQDGIDSAVAAYEIILEASVVKARKQVAEEIKSKLYHPPISFGADETDLVQIMVKVRKYYQIVHDEATGKGG